MRPIRTAAARAPERAPRLRVVTTNGRGMPVRAAGLARWVARVAPARARGEVTIALVSDRRIRRLNRQYRKIDCATDVLSFPAGHQITTSPNHPILLGDLAISVDTARRQAGRLGHSVSTELRILALHGLLHLLGYDHERDRGEMARLERRLRRRAGLPDALTERR